MPGESKVELESRMWDLSHLIDRRLLSAPSEQVIEDGKVTHKQQVDIDSYTNIGIARTFSLGKANPVDYLLKYEVDGHPDSSRRTNTITYLWSTPDIVLRGLYVSCYRVHRDLASEGPGYKELNLHHARSWDVARLMDTFQKAQS